MNTRGKETPVYDKNKHGNEFRLRLLATNACSLNCKFCLNDFQPKPKHFANYLSPILARDYILAYSNFVRERCSHDPLINISGGEPGLHPDLLSIVEACSEAKAHLMLNTNGLVFQHRDWREIQKHIGDLRIHVHPGEFIPYRNMGMMPMSFQAVFTKEMTLFDANALVNYYGNMKFFVDFYGDAEVNKRYEATIKELREVYPDHKIEARFTGIQQNRGPGCLGCKKRCITLKALWVYPHGGTSPCPQTNNCNVIRATQSPYKVVEGAYNFHKIDDGYGSQGSVMTCMLARMAEKDAKDGK